MDHQSDMQKHMIRNSYRMHKQRLSSIKHNNTSLQFYSSNKSKLQDRKKLMMLQQRRQEIVHQNSILQEKINKIKGRESKEQARKQLDEIKKDKHTNNRYVEQNQQEGSPIEVNSNYGDEMIKCIIPAPHTSKKKYYSQPKKLKALNHTSSALRQQLQNFNQNKITLQIRKSVFSKGKQQDNILHPQQDIDRVVLYKKTTIIAPMVSCLTEISLLGRRILITAYVMGAENHTATLFLDEQKTNQLILGYSDNFEALGSKVSIDNHWQIRLAVVWNDDKKLDLLDNSRKVKQPITKEQKYASQQDFIKRNYYIKYKKQQINESEQHSNLKASINKPKTSREVSQQNPVLRKFGIKPSYNSSTDIKETVATNIQSNKKTDIRVNNFSNKQKKKQQIIVQNKSAKQSIENKRANNKQQVKYQQDNNEQVEEFNGADQNQYEQNYVDQTDKKGDSQSLKNISEVQKKQPQYEEDYQEVFQDNQSSIKNVSSVKNQSSIKQSSLKNKSSVKNQSGVQNQSKKFTKKPLQEEQINEQQYGQEEFQNNQKADQNNYQQQYQQQYNEQIDNGDNYGEDFEGDNPA